MSLKDQLRIMVVDDMSTSRALIEQAMDEIGFSHVVYQNDPDQAFRRLTMQPVHLVISDYHMPGLSGLQLLAALRGHQNTRAIGFILVSGRLDQTILAEGQKYGLNNFIAKPFTTPSMRDCIEKVVGRL